MIAGVADLAAAHGAIEVLSGHSYVHAPHRPRALWFHKPAAPALADAEAGIDLGRRRP